MTKWKKIVLLAFVLTAVTGTTSCAYDFIDPIENIDTVKVAAVTGTRSMNRTNEVGVVGTDLGIMAEIDGIIYIAFGDTFSYNKTNWRSNVMAFTTDTNPSNGITLDGWVTDATGRAKELVPGLKQNNDAGGEVTKIPTALTAIGNRLYMAFMSVRHWGPPGEWDANHATWAYSDDQGRSWKIVDPPMWPEGSGFIMLATSQQRGRGNEDGYLWILATPAGRFGAVKAARVRPGRILDPSAYQYYGGLEGFGRPRWVSTPADAAEIIPAPVGEGSLLWNRFLDCWIYTYLNEKTHNLELRCAPYPWGPWGNPHTLAKASDYPSLYGAFMTPSWVKDDGRAVYFLMSQFGPYNVYLMRAEFIKKPQN